MFGHDFGILVYALLCGGDKNNINEVFYSYRKKGPR